MPSAVGRVDDCARRLVTEAFRASTFERRTVHPALHLGFKRRLAPRIIVVDEPHHALVVVERGRAEDESLAVVKVEVDERDDRACTRCGNRLASGRRAGRKDGRSGFWAVKADGASGEAMNLHELAILRHALTSDVRAQRKQTDAHLVQAQDHDRPLNLVVIPATPTRHALDADLERLLAKFKLRFRADQAFTLLQCRWGSGALRLAEREVVLQANKDFDAFDAEEREMKEVQRWVIVEYTRLELCKRACESRKGAQDKPSDVQ